MHSKKTDYAAHLTGESALNHSINLLFVDRQRATTDSERRDRARIYRVVDLSYMSIRDRPYIPTDFWVSGEAGKRSVSVLMTVQENPDYRTRRALSTLSPWERIRVRLEVCFYLDELFCSESVRKHLWVGRNQMFSTDFGLDA
jgi:hypothetical protein